MPHDRSSLFSDSYSQARARFQATCAAAGVPFTRHDHPLTGPQGEPLSLDTAWVGPSDAPKVLVLMSATHGVEGFVGSAVQLDFLHRLSPDDLPEGCAALLLHALNPHGFAWLRRVNEAGVDLNRNFIDFDQPLPESPGYDELAEALVPPRNDPALWAEADQILRDYGRRHGQRVLETVVTAGQYSHPSGLFYGGTAPVWSRLRVERLIDDFHLKDRQTVAVIDLHSGLGPFGHGEIISDHPPQSAEAARGRRWYGTEMTEPALGTSYSTPKSGLIDYGWQAALGAAVTFVTLEFGTFSVEEMLRALRADHVLHRDGLPNWDAPETQRIKADLRRFFYPATADWQDLVLRRAQIVVGRALAGLSAP
ncbi:M14 family metallopeptidase [Magnetospira thiophila]